MQQMSARNSQRPHECQVTCQLPIHVEREVFTHKSVAPAILAAPPPPPRGCAGDMCDGCRISQSILQEMPDLQALLNCHGQSTLKGKVTLQLPIWFEQSGLGQKEAPAL